MKKSPIRTLILPFREFIKTESSGGIILLICTIAALIAANSPLSGAYFHLWEMKISLFFNNAGLDKPLHFWINDGLMAVFFFVVGLEIKREMIVGELSTLKKAAFPAVAAFGGMAVPALIYTLFNAGGIGANGWGIPTATDIAFAIGIISLLGRRVPFSLKIFLTALAIVDDIGAVLVIAIFYTAGISLPYLLVSIGFVAALAACNRLGIRKPFVYVILGIFLWYFFYLTGIHPTIAGVAAAMTIPARTRINAREFIESGKSFIEVFERAGSSDGKVLSNSAQQAALVELETACERAEPPIIRLEHSLHPWVTYMIMPLFAFANAGVALGSNFTEALTNSIALGVMLGLLIGKPAGIFIFTFLAVKLGLADKPSGVKWSRIFGVGIFGGIGFTMSLFIGGLAFADPVLLDNAKIGILGGSLLAALCGWAVIRLLSGKKPTG